MPPYKALYGKRCQSLICWDEFGEKKILTPDLVQVTTEKIRLIQDKMLTTQNKQRSYANKRGCDLEFEKGDHVFLKVMWTKDVMRFRKKSKFNPRFIGPFEILKQVGDLSYELALPPELSHMHCIFCLSMLRKYMHNTSHILEYEPLQVSEDLSYEEQPMMLLDRNEQVF